ncbi:MAG: DUF4435 domain-containing protein, partial [Scytonema sp. PMC 1069.18]|nr:DUF4435 domain-containing protein [Scytonema sp. PMC 1069.18]
MRDLLSVDREANAIRLQRSTYSGNFLLVEGTSDKTFYERFVDKLACKLVSVSGKPSSKQRVIEVLKILEKSSFPGILAIVDADFDRLETSSYSSPNLFRTDQTVLSAICGLLTKKSTSVKQSFIWTFAHGKVTISHLKFGGMTK